MPLLAVRSHPFCRELDIAIRVKAWTWNADFAERDTLRGRPCRRRCGVKVAPDALRPMACCVGLVCLSEQLSRVLKYDRRWIGTFLFPTEG